MTSMETRDQPLGDILSITTGCLLSRRHMDGVYDILNWLTQDDLFTHQLPRAAEWCAPRLLRQLPQLAGVEPPPGLDADGLWAWLDEAEHRYGAKLPVARLDGWEHRDAIEEACDMMGADRVYVAPAEAAQ